MLQLSWATFSSGFISSSVNKTSNQEMEAFPCWLNMLICRTNSEQESMQIAALLRLQHAWTQTGNRSRFSRNNGTFPWSEVRVWMLKPEAGRSRKQTAERVKVWRCVSSPNRSVRWNKAASISSWQKGRFILDSGFEWLFICGIVKWKWEDENERLWVQVELWGGFYAKPLVHKCMSQVKSPRCEGGGEGGVKERPAVTSDLSLKAQILDLLLTVCSTESRNMTDRLQ